MAMVQSAGPLPNVTPAPKPLRFPFNLVKLLSNNVEIIPLQAYEQEVVVAPGPPRIAFLTGADAVEKILKTDAFDFPKDRLQIEITAPLFGTAMGSSEGAEWRWQRGAMAPLFRHEQLLSYVPIMQAAADATITAWRAAPAGTEHAINRDMMRAAFAVISQTMLAGGADEVIAAIEKGHGAYFQQINWWVLHRMLRLPAWFPRPGGRIMRRQEKLLRDSVDALVRERRDHAAGGDDLLGRLLTAKDPETDRAMPHGRLIDNIIALLVSGYDTTALTLTWTLYLLARHGDWEARILDEVQALAGDGPITADHLPDLIIVEQVLKEAMRLYPAAPIILREIPEDTQFGDVTVPAGTIGMVPIYAVHRHRNIWDDPENFDPSRFAADASFKPGRYTYLPFGAGPRICIGAAFSMMESKIMLANFVRAARFAVRPGFEPRPTGQMFLTAGGPLPLQVTLRDGSKA